jgi:hypothetical protein
MGAEHFHLEECLGTNDMLLAKTMRSTERGPVDTGYSEPHEGC